MAGVRASHNGDGWRESRRRLLLGIGVGLLLVAMFQGPLSLWPGRWTQILF
jgi:hypothetical protein